MKKRVFSLLFLAIFVVLGSAQADLQPLAMITLQSPTEQITLRQLKARVDMYKKQGVAPPALSVEQKKAILEAMIDERLTVQAAQKAGITVTGQEVDQYFVGGISEQFGRPITEQEFAVLIKEETGKSLDDYFRSEIGMNLAEYKAYLKSQLLARRYLIQQKQGELQQQATPTDKEIRDFFAMNQSRFIQSEMSKLFLVLIPKGADARNKITGVYAELKDKKATPAALKIRYKDSTGLQAGDILVSRTPEASQQLHVSPEQLSELFNRNIGFISDIIETPNDFQFYQIQEKYPAKMLTLSDVIGPDSTTTVYEYIRENLGQQKQAAFMQEAINDITKSLRIPANYKMLKTDKALDDLLINW